MLAEEARKEAAERETDTSGFVNRGKQYMEVHVQTKYTCACTVYTYILRAAQRCKCTCTFMY